MSERKGKKGKKGKKKEKKGDEDLKDEMNEVEKGENKKENLPTLKNQKEGKEDLKDEIIQYINLRREKAVQTIKRKEKETLSFIKGQEEELLRNLETLKNSHQKNLLLQAEEIWFFLESLQETHHHLCALLDHGKPLDLCDPSLLFLLSHTSSLLSSFLSFPSPKQEAHNPSLFQVQGDEEIKGKISRSLNHQDLFSLVSADHSFAQGDPKWNGKSIPSVQTIKVTIFPADWNGELIEFGQVSDEFEIYFSPAEPIKVGTKKRKDAKPLTSLFFFFFFFWSI